MASPDVSRRRIAIAADGSVTGDETPDVVVAALRYACRMASQVEPLLDLGQLQWLTTLSGTAITARIARAGDGLSVTAELEERPHRLARHAFSDTSDANGAAKRSLLWVRDELEAEWCSIITAEKLVVGAVLPDPKIVPVDVRAVLPEVGVRALAVLGALEVAFQETSVILQYARGSLLLVAIRGDVLFAFGDRFDPDIARPLIERVRSLLGPHNLARVWLWGQDWA